MSLSNTPSEVQKPQINVSELSIESQNRVNAVATQAIDILDKNPDGQKAVRDMFDKMIAGNMRDPENVFKLQKWLYEARDARLAMMKPFERLWALTAFSSFMGRFTEQLARINGSIQLSNEARDINSATRAKMDAVKATYAQVFENAHPETETI
jgi:hypothetical protein